MMTINEADTRAELIGPKPKAADWGVEADGSIRREVICPGRILTGGKCNDKVASDYVLGYKGRKLAAVEVEKESLSYAQRLLCRIAYATNGHEIYQIDRYRGKFNTLGELKKPSCKKLSRVNLQKIAKRLPYE